MEGAVSCETLTKLCGITFQDCDLNAQRCIQWQVDFLFLKYAFPLIICTYFIGYTKTSIRTLNFPWKYVSVPTQFLYYTFRLSLNWSVAVVLSTCNLKSGNRNDFQVRFLTHTSSVVVMPYASCIVYSGVTQLRWCHSSILTAGLHRPDQWRQFS